jgi:hypothetical protein
LLLLVAGCGTDDRPTDPAGRSLGATINPGHRAFRIAVFAPSAGGDVVLDGIDLRFDSERGEVSCRAAVVNITDHPLYAPLELVITDLLPDRVGLVGADRRTGGGEPLVDFSAAMGEDGILAPGEASQRVPMVFADPARAPIVLGAVLNLGIGPPHGAVGGVVFSDQNPNGRRDRGEPGIPGIPVALLEGEKVIAETRTDPNGRYVFLNLHPGLHAVRKGAPDLELVTPNPLHVALVPVANGQAKSCLSADFACFRRHDPGDEARPLLGPLRVLASGETVTGHFELTHLPRMPLLLVVEVTGVEGRELGEAEVAVNGHSVLAAADFVAGPRLVRGEILPDWLRLGQNTVEVRAQRDVEGEGEAFLIANVIGK